MASKRKGATAAKGSPAKVRALRKRLKTLIARARTAQKAARIRAKRQVEVLQTRQVAARRVLAKLGRQGAAASGPILGGLQRAWRELDVAVRQGAKRFRETS